jgi:hypothetical protein
LSSKPWHWNQRRTWKLPPPRIFPHPPTTTPWGNLSQMDNQLAQKGIARLLWRRFNLYKA